MYARAQIEVGRRTVTGENCQQSKQMTKKLIDNLEQRVKAGLTVVSPIEPVSQLKEPCQTGSHGVVAMWHVVDRC